MIEAKNINKIFNYPEKLEILKKINLKIEKGKAIALMGASGEGKTTLLHILGALEKPSSGKVLMFNKPYQNFSTLRNRFFGFIFQSHNLLEDFSVIYNVTMPANIARQKTTLPQKLLQEVGLENRANYLTKLLSGGEKQRVAIARAFCNDPEVIFADEPSGNLDHKNSQNIHNLLLSFVKKKNKSLVVVTHDEDLANMCDERYILKSGFLLT